MAQMTDSLAQAILNGAGFTRHEVEQLAHHWLETSQQRKVPVGMVRHFIYEGIARNGPSIEAQLFDGVDLPDSTVLYAEPKTP